MYVPPSHLPFRAHRLHLAVALALCPPAAALAQAPAASDAVTLPAVSVRAGKLSDASTEDAGYVATSASIGKEARGLRELPNAVTVVTRKELDDRNIHTIEDALKNVTGVTIQRYDASGNYSQFMARGFAADTYQLDGLTLLSDANSIYFDLAGYDRVEVQRGAAGLFSGAGEPGVTVNIARKRALAEPKTEAAVSVGSWDNYRADLDVSRALNASASLRGRLVAAFVDNGTFMDGIDNHKRFLYGTVEADLAPRTTLSLGFTWQDVDTVLSRGLPTRATGQFIDMPRETMVTQSWNNQRLESVGYFAELERRGLDDSTLKFALRRVERGNDARYIDPAIPRTDGTMSGTTQATALYASAFERNDSDTSFDAYYSTPFQLAGQKHNFLIGADYRISRTHTRYASYGMLPGASLNLFKVDRDAIPQPAFTYVLGSPSTTRVLSYGLYSQLRYKPAAAWTLIGGGRISSWKSQAVSDAGARTGYSESGEFTPFVAAIYDVSASTSVYASYNQIFKPQNNLDAAGKQIEPRTGKQYELGLKGELLGSRLTWQADVFHLTDQNRAVALDSNRPNVYFALGKVLAKGAEAELRGEISPQWSVTGGYAYTQTKYLRSTAAQQGTAFSPITPKHNVNLSTQYKLGAGFAQGLEIGGGARLVSKFYNDPRVRGPGYGIAFLNAAYPLSPTYRVTLNIDNLFDKTYYEKVSGTTRQNFFGTPRSFTVALRGSF